MSISANPVDYVYVPLRADLFAELIRQSGRSNVSGYVESQIQAFLERAKRDHSLWSAECFELQIQDTNQEFTKMFGNRSRGYQWKELFIPNGSQIRMFYSGKAHFAYIQNEKLWFGKQEVSPSRFASIVANGTSRNAWRDIYILFPGEKAWKYADNLRKKSS